jgi:hypothetical protein
MIALGAGEENEPKSRKSFLCLFFLPQKKTDFSCNWYHSGGRVFFTLDSGAFMFSTLLTVAAVVAASSTNSVLTAC